MSHTTTLKNVAIRDVMAMQQAVNDLQAEGINCELVENESPRMYYTKQGEKCEYVLKLKDGQYDLGFKYQDDGTYAPVLDTWGGHLGKQIGATCPMPDSQEGRAQHAIGKFMQGYSRNATINAAVQKGYSVEGTETDADGNVHLTIGV